MRRKFGEVIVRLATKDSTIVLLTGDVEQEMDEFKQKFPLRFFNLGLTEQSIISIAAGLAIEGMRPIVYSLTPFLLERPFEQIKIDIDEQNLPVILIGFDNYPTHGNTHRALNAKGLVGLFKNITGYFPCNEFDTEKAMIEAYMRACPVIICLHSISLPPGWGVK